VQGISLQTQNELTPTQQSSYSPGFGMKGKILNSPLQTHLYSTAPTLLLLTLRELVTDDMITDAASAVVEILWRPIQERQVSSNEDDILGVALVISKLRLRDPDDGRCSRRARVREEAYVRSRKPIVLCFDFLLPTAIGGSKTTLLYTCSTSVVTFGFPSPVDRRKGGTFGWK
jgi:hypothetical protein